MPNLGNFISPSSFIQVTINDTKKLNIILGKFYLELEIDKIFLLGYWLLVLADYLQVFVVNMGNV